MSSVAIVGAGNPLLDISAHVDLDFLKKWGLSLNNAILADASHVPLYEELVKSYPVEYIAGGATQNSIRVAQWVSRTPGITAYIGGIGADAFGEALTAACKKDGVLPLYDVTEKPTGTCAVLIHDKERSLVANLSAAEAYRHDHVTRPEVAGALDAARIFYSAGFFLTHASPVMVEMGKKAAAGGKTYAMNLSAPFLCQFFKDQMHAVLPYADFVFGNESEAAAFGENNGLAGASVADVAIAIAALPKANASRARTVVITQGADATIVASNGEVKTFPVPKIAKEAIVDTNGAGDAFVGGFLAQLAAGKPIDTAVKAGHWAAGHVIQRSGCTFDADAAFNESA